MFQPIKAAKIKVGSTVYTGYSAYDHHPIWKQKVIQILIGVHHSNIGFTEAKVLTDKGEVHTATWYGTAKTWWCTTCHVSESPKYNKSLVEENNGNKV